MNNSDKNQFDSSIRESATNFELPFNDAAWKLMDKKLNKEFGNSKKKRFGFLITCFAISAAFLGFYLYSINDSDDNIAKNKQEYKPKNTLNNLFKLNKEQGNVINYKSIDSIIINDISERKKLNRELNKQKVERNCERINNNIIASDFLIKNKIEEKISNNKVVKENQLIINNNEKIKLNNKYSNINQNELAPAAISKAHNINIKNLSEIEKSKSATSVISKTITNVLDKKSSNSKMAIANYNSSQMHTKFLPKYKIAEIEAAKIPKPDLSLYELNPIDLMTVYPEIPLPNRWYIGGNFAGNISYSSNPRIADLKMGYNFILGFNLNNQVSFQTGFGVGNKQFDLKRNQLKYEGPNLIWNKYIREAYVDVDILEIPISIRYQFSEKPNKGLFCTAGISKLFFNKENYTLNLDYGSGTATYKFLNFSNNTTGFTMFNASLGYQFSINKYYTVTAEQYIQLPTKNIGGNSIRMSSTGLQVGIKYNFIGKKK